MKILITGGTGMIGSVLYRKLKDRGHDVAVLSRSRKRFPGRKVFWWDPRHHRIEDGALDYTECIVHLAGENLAKRWTKREKKKINASRVQSAQFLFEKVRERNRCISTFVSASAIGYYGATTSEHVFTEDDHPANDFLSRVCIGWEEAADNFMKLGARVVKIRTSPVLSASGGILKKLALPVKLGIGSALGSGRQYMPWVHIDDLCGIYIKAIEDSTLEGVFNAAAPHRPSNEEVMRTLASVLDKPFWFPKIPSFLMRLFFGELAEVTLNGSRVSGEKIVKEGFSYQYPTLQTALENIYSKDR